MLRSAAGLFQVNCPHCTRALQVQAGVGVHPVQCASCSKPFNVQIHESFLPTRAARATRQPKEARVLNATLVAYNTFQKHEHKRLMRDRLSLSAEQRFRLVETRWQSSSSNPKNQGIQATADGTIGAGTSDAGRAAPPASAPTSPATDPAAHPAGEPAVAASSPSPRRVSNRGVSAALAAAARAALLDPTAAARPAAAPDPPAEAVVVEEEEGEEEEEDEELSMAAISGADPTRRGRFAAIHAAVPARTAASRGGSRARGTTQGRGAGRGDGRGRGRGRGLVASRGRGRGRGRGDGAARNTEETEESWAHVRGMVAANEVVAAQRAARIADNEVVIAAKMLRGWTPRIDPSLGCLIRKNK